MLDSVHLLVSHPSSSVGAALTASFSIHLLFDLLGAMQKSTSGFKRIYSGALLVFKENAKWKQRKRSGRSTFGGEFKNAKWQPEQRADKVKKILSYRVVK